MDDYQFENKRQQIHCETAGLASNESSIIFLHGVASNATRWRELIENLGLKDKSYLLAMNLRGHGHSMTYRHYRRQDWCSDLHTLVNNFNKPTILVGHSMGAQIALDYAINNPAQLRGLLLIDPVFPQAFTGVLKKISYFRWLIAFIASIIRIFTRLGIRKRNYPYRDLQELDQQTRRFLADNPGKDIAELYMNPISDLKFMPVANYLNDLVEVSRKLPPLDKINIPVLVLLSSGASTSDVDINRKLLRHLPNLDIKTIHADHWLLTEKPDEARAIIEAWCEQQFEYKN